MLSVGVTELPLLHQLRHGRAIDIARGDGGDGIWVLPAADDAEQELQALFKDLLHPQIDGRDRRRHVAAEGVRPVVGREEKELLADPDAGFVHRGEQAAGDALVVAVEHLLQLPLLNQAASEFIAVFRRTLAYELALAQLQTEFLGPLCEGGAAQVRRDVETAVPDGTDGLAAALESELTGEPACRLVVDADAGEALITESHLKCGTLTVF